MCNEREMTMENSDETRLIVKIAQLYYEQDMTQAQIARELGIYRTTISRLLKRGREQGIVTIAINYDYNENLWLEQQLKQKFALKEVVVASGDALPEEDQLTIMGQQGAQLLERLLEPGDIIGFSWGRAVRSLVENLPQSSQSRQLICVPIIGGPSGKLESRYHVNTLTYSAAARLKGESHLADFPALLDNELIRNGIMQSHHFKTIAAYWNNLDVALVGIGSPAIRDGANWHAFYGSEESDDLHARQVAGDICSRFYDINGATVETNMNEKTLSIEMPRLKQARYSIGVAMGEEKYSGILGALHGKYINCLVTDKKTAELLLQ
jgi:DNA-binding transcriptional regulator LsrR (DeoR family)